MARRAPRDWIDAGFDALVDGGPRAVAVEPLARRLGVTKGSFYWHFPDRAALLAAMLASWEEGGTERIIRDVEAASDDAWDRITQLGRRTFGSDERANAIEAALRGWALVDDAAAAVVGRVDERRLAYVRELLEAVGVPPDRATDRAAITYRLLIGDFAWTGYGGQPLPWRALEDFLRLITSDDTGPPANGRRR